MIACCRPVAKGGFASWLVLPVLLMAVSGSGQTAPPSAEEIVRRSAEATHADWEKLPQYDFCETDRNKDGSKTFEVMMIAGSPFNRLVAVNGSVLSKEAEQAEEQRFEAAVKHRQQESAQERQQRVAQYEKERKRDRGLLEQMTDAMDYKLAGTETVGTHATYVLDASPKPGYQAKNAEGQVLTGMRGRLWIDQASFRWVKVEAEVVRPVMIAGFLARVEPGTRFALEESPIDKEIWSGSHFTMQFHAKVVFVVNKSGQTDETYFHYKAKGSLTPEACQQP
jgi:hypothetical protein